MANIIGEPFQPWVKTQIEKRQQALGKTNIDSNTLKWVTTKTPWLRLASSVDVNNTIIANLLFPVNHALELVLVANLSQGDAVQHIYTDTEGNCTNHKRHCFGCEVSEH